MVTGKDDRLPAMWCLHGYEIDEKRYHAALARCVFEGGLALRDFLDTEPNPVFDRVLMNPPFAKQDDIRHVLHALKFLKPGGRLVAIMSASTMFRANKLAADFRGLVASMGGSIELLPDGAFKASGTAVSTCVVTIEAKGCVPPVADNATTASPIRQRGEDEPERSARENR